MAIVISSQKMYSLVNNFEDQPAESLMKKRRDTTFSISCWFWSLKRKRLRQNWRGSRLVVDISAVATTSPPLATIHQNWWLQRSHKPKYRNIQPHRNHQSWRVQWNLHHIFVFTITLLHWEAPDEGPTVSPYTGRSCWLCQDIRPHGGVLYWPALWDTWVIWWWCMPETRALTFKDNRIR